MKLRLGWVALAFFCIILPAVGQNVAASLASVSVPPVIQFSNVASDDGGTSLSGTVAITFSLYNRSQGGQALWTERTGKKHVATGDPARVRPVRNRGLTSDHWTTNHQPLFPNL